MQKLKYNIIKKMMESEVTSTEINLLIYMSHYQSDRGSITGVYYKSVSDDLNISYQAFYDALYGLQKKGLIMIRKGSYYDWDVLIVNNNYADQDAAPASYLNTGKDLFYDKRFYGLKAREKLLAMYIIVIAGAGRGSYHIGTKEFCDKFCKIFQVTKRALQGYLTSLKQFFSIGIKAGKYWITPLKALKEKSNAPRDKDIFAQGLTKTIVRRTRAVFTERTFQDTAGLIVQYFNDYRDDIQGSFMRAVECSLKLKNQCISNQYKWNRELHPAFIHKLLVQDLQDIKSDN